MAHGIDPDRMTLTDLPDVMRHLGHLNEVRGGGLLVGSVETAVLPPDEFFRGARRPRLKAGTWSTKGRMRLGNKVVPTTTTWANSAEGIRQLKAMWGVPARPVEVNDA